LESVKSSTTGSLLLFSQSAMFLVLCLPLLYPLFSSLESFGNPIFVSGMLAAALGIALFVLLRRNMVQASRLMSAADILWHTWSFVGILLLFSSASMFSQADLKHVLQTMGRFPFLYSLIVTGLLTTAAGRIAVCCNALFSPVE
jgi:hypothetical protein